MYLTYMRHIQTIIHLKCRFEKDYRLVLADFSNHVVGAKSMKKNMVADTLILKFLEIFESRDAVKCLDDWTVEQQLKAYATHLFRE